MNFQQSSSTCTQRPESLLQIRRQVSSIVAKHNGPACAPIFEHADRIAKQVSTTVGGRRRNLYDVFNDAHAMGAQREPWNKKDGTDLQLLVHLDHLKIEEKIQTTRSNLIAYFTPYLHAFFEGSRRNMEMFADSIIVVIEKTMFALEHGKKKTVQVVDPVMQDALPFLAQTFEGYLSLPHFGFMPADSIGDMLIGGQQGINLQDDIVIHGCQHMRCTTHARIQQLLFRLGIPIENTPTDPMTIWMNELGRNTDIHTLPTGCTMGTIVDSDFKALDFRKSDKLFLGGNKVANRPGLPQEVLERGGTLLPSNLLIALEEIGELFTIQKRNST